MTKRRLEQSRRAEQALAAFHAAPLDEILARNLSVAPEQAVLSHFRSVAHDVPAYAEFLRRHGVDPASVASIEDFRRVPQTTKENYQRGSALPDLCRSGALDACDMIAVSSGSTGKPAFWPRFVTDELGTAVRFEQVLHDAFRSDERSTLAVICFALGSWVGGMYTASCCRHLAAKGYPITVVTPGNQKQEILRVVSELRDHYDQVVLFGYPPFLKDVVDAGRADGFDWSRTPVRLVMAGEVFSEEWRSLVCERLGAGDPAHGSASLYGTADAGVLANETPLSIRIRRFLATEPALAHELFGEARLPTLCQYDPLHRYFECDGGDLVFSGDSGAPLVRYRILDRGGLFTYAELLGRVREHGFDPLAGLATDARERVRDLPFVFVFGRSSFAVSFYGANVYPENVSVGLEQPEFAAHVTGKFVMEVVSDADLNAELHVAIELAPRASASAELADRIARSLRTHMERLNSEFRNYAPAECRTPRVRLLACGDPEYFPVGVKHRYTRQ
jgi:phenylacetate-CoA ligase